MIKADDEIRFAKSIVGQVKQEISRLELLIRDHGFTDPHNTVGWLKSLASADEVR